MTDDELIVALNSLKDESVNNGRNGVCTFTLLNDCPSGWGVTILVAGVNFYYIDGSSETVGPRPVQLKSGQSAVFLSTKAAGCVKKSFLAMKVHIEGEGVKDMTHMGEDAGQGQCYLRDGIKLGPKRLVREERLGAGVFDLIEADVIS